MKLKNILNLKNIAIAWYWIEWKANHKFLNDIKFKWSIDILNSDKDFSNLQKYDLILKSPWISKYKYKEIFELSKIWKVSSSTEIFLNNAKWKFIAITWTKWKSTTSSITYSILKFKFWKNAKLIWNIWTPAISQLIWSKSDDIFVIELSSYQIEDLKWVSIDLGILVNIFPDHLDYHDWFDNYRKAKGNMFKISKKTIYKDENNFFSKVKWKKSIIKQIRINNAKIRLKWDHNKSNIQFAIIAAKQFWVNVNTCLETIVNFKWLPCRLQELKMWNKIWVNDSISTTPESTIVWVKVYQEVIEWIILWGKDRWYDFESLIIYLSKIPKLKAIALLPENNKKILTLIIKIFQRKPKILESSNMKKIIEFLDSYTWKNSAILLSTASPSYNLYENFLKQWEDFEQNIKSHFVFLKNK